ncbi:putative ErfK/YbiS/YcfS/YnhG family protein [Candidatus Zixiibacteriota bacterium]|nr:putative ErfK/YbiS/YcfS/YnhG family protein [candidate division Zixibacteria bacterium]
MRKLIIGFGIILLLIGAVIVLFVGAPNPPTVSLEHAKQMLNKAEKAASLRYSPEMYRAAEDLIKIGWMEMARQNGRLAPFRNYKTADSLLTLAYQKASDAADQAQKTLQNLQATVQGERNQLYDELLEWRESLNGTLAKNDGEAYWNRAEMAYKTSEKLMNMGEYEEARSKIILGKESLRHLGKIVADYSNDEAQKLHIWQRWVQETIDNSRADGTYAVIVDKGKHKAYLIHRGKLKLTFDCDLGYNPSTQKLFAGDGATPEGKYYVTAVKGNGASRYYKALLINYPNATDRQRFAESKSRGIISKRSRIGGLIEIHGEGGRNRDWTEGCVALSNRDMDRLMQYISIGTPVTIVRRSNNWP